MLHVDLLLLFCVLMVTIRGVELHLIVGRIMVALKGRVASVRLDVQSTPASFTSQYTPLLYLVWVCCDCTGRPRICRRSSVVLSVAQRSAGSDGVLSPLLLQMCGGTCGLTHRGFDLLKLESTKFGAAVYGRQSAF